MNPIQRAALLTSILIGVGFSFRAYQNTSLDARLPRELAWAESLENEPLSSPAPNADPAHLQDLIEQQRERMVELNDKISLLEEQRYERQFKMSRLLSDMAQAQTDIQNLYQERDRVKQQIFDRYADQGRAEKAQEVNENTQLADLESQIHRSRLNLQNLNQRIRELNAQGFNSDELAENRRKFEMESKRIENLNDQLQNQKVQAGTASFMRQQQQAWERNKDQQDLRENFHQQLRLQESKLQKLEKNYQEFQQQESSQAKELAKAEQEYQDHKNRFNELQDLFQKRISQESGGDGRNRS